MAEYPADNSAPWGATLKAYIDDAVLGLRSVISGDIATPTSEVGAALETRLAPLEAQIPALSEKPDLSNQQEKPFYIAHRGGHLIYGEHSLEAYTAAAEAGFAIEPDVNILSDGGLACIHDSSTTRTMVQIEGTPKTGVSSISSADFLRNYRVLPEVAGSPYESPVLFDTVLDLFGGRVLICPEMKDSATRVAVCDAIVERGLEKAVIAQSFNFADVQYSASRGITSAWLTDSGSPVNMVAAGIEYAAPSANASQAYVDSCIAAGLRIIRWTVNSRTQADTLLSTGSDSLFSDDPWWISGRYERSYTDPFRKARPWPHMVTNGDRPNQMFKDGGFGYRYPIGGAATTTGSPNDWCLPLTSGKASIYFTVDFGPNAQSQTRWASIAFGKFHTIEHAYNDFGAGGQHAFHILIRRMGTLEIFETPLGLGATLRASSTGSSLADAGRSSGPIKFKFERTATAVTLTNLSTGQSVTWADSTNIFADSRFQFNFNGTDATIKDVRVEPIT